MKILVIAKNINLNAAGIVYGSFLEELFTNGNNHIDLLTNTQYVANTNSGKVHTVPNQKELTERLVKLLLIITGKNFKNINWFLATKKYIKKHFTNDNSYDWIISFVNGGEESAAHVGLFISKMNNAKFYIHMVDPIPPPKGWENHEVYRKKLFNGIKKPLQLCNLFSLSNKQMTSYQANLIKNIDKSFTLPNPVQSDKLIELKRNTNSSTYNYLFLGTSITGARNPYKLFVAFSKVCEAYPDSRLFIYGNTRRLDTNKIPEKVKNKIIIEPFTDDINKVIENSDCFIDIDGDLEFDVFISSKLQLYLSFNRPLVSITGAKSPSRLLLKNMNKSTVVSGFDTKKIESSLIKARNIEMNKEFIAEREDFISVNNTKYLVSKMLNKLNNYL